MTPTPNNPPDGLFDEDINEENPQPTHIIASSSDSEDEALTNGGYELLPQESDLELEENHAAAFEDGVIPAEENLNTSYDCHLLSDQVNEAGGSRAAGDLPDLWNGSTSSTQIMDAENIERIKAAMADFTLPNSAVPEWARIIPEEEWKAQLFARIKVRQTCQDAMSEGFHEHSLSRSDSPSSPAPVQ